MHLTAAHLTAEDLDTRGRGNQSTRPGQAQRRGLSADGVVLVAPRRQRVARGTPCGRPSPVLGLVRRGPKRRDAWGAADQDMGTR